MELTGLVPEMGRLNTSICIYGGSQLKSHLSGVLMPDKGPCTDLAL